jgi:hypothetical protein
MSGAATQNASTGNHSIARHVGQFADLINFACHLEATSHIGIEGVVCHVLSVFADLKKFVHRNMYNFDPATE